MATRNIVPRADGEGNIGTSAKNWLSAFFKTINVLGALICTQIATPSNPASGSNKLYFKSDGKLYKLSSAGVEAEVGTGSSDNLRVFQSDTGEITVQPGYFFYRTGPAEVITRVDFAGIVDVLGNGTFYIAVDITGGYQLTAQYHPEYFLLGRVTIAYLAITELIDMRDGTMLNAYDSTYFDFDASGEMTLVLDEFESAGAVSTHESTYDHSHIPTSSTFTNASLSTGKLTITHNKALSAPYAIIIAIFDNNNKQIIPDEITGATNSVEIDLTSYGTLSGTWGYMYIA